MDLHTPSTSHRLDPLTSLIVCRKLLDVPEVLAAILAVSLDRTSVLMRNSLS